jgi:hypothetical protein
VGVFSTSDAVVNVVTQSFSVVLPILIFVAAQRTRAASSSRLSAASP